nr:MAG TPA: hypothetical protein [Caudoviricetes sp.]
MAGAPSAPPPHHTKVLGGGGVGFGEGRRKPFSRRVPPPLPKALANLPIPTL